MSAISVERFGKDHWSTFLYIEIRCVGHGGVPVHEYMPEDSWSHAKDCMSVDLILQHGTDSFPIFELTPLGWNVASQLRQHLATGGVCADFVPDLTPDGKDAEIEKLRATIDRQMETCRIDTNQISEQQQEIKRLREAIESAVVALVPTRLVDGAEPLRLQMRAVRDTLHRRLNESVGVDPEVQ
jgi:hypothetical protein